MTAWGEDGGSERIACYYSDESSVGTYGLYAGLDLLCAQLVISALEDQEAMACAGSSLRLICVYLET